MASTITLTWGLDSEEGLPSVGAALDRARVIASERGSVVHLDEVSTSPPRVRPVALMRPDGRVESTGRASGPRTQVLRR